MIDHKYPYIFHTRNTNLPIKVADGLVKDITADLWAFVSLCTAVSVSSVSDKTRHTH